MDHECFNLQNDEFEEELKAQRIKDQEFLDTFKELCDSVIKKQREERERIAKEKEAEELEAERKKKECLKIENSLSKASTHSRRSRIDPSLKGFKVFCKTISLGEMQRIPEESVSSLKMGDEHLNTQKDSRESSVKYPIHHHRELDLLPDEYYDEDYQNIHFFELDEEIITLEKDVLQNGVISNSRENNDTVKRRRDFKIIKEEIDISCDYNPPGIDTDDDSEGDVPPFEEPLDDVLFPLLEVDILPIEVEPVEVMFNDSHTYGENISQVEREFQFLVRVNVKSF
ncbi:hypothetical protein Tco_0383266 [Tanacetum coccineum]